MDHLLAPPTNRDVPDLFRLLTRIRVRARVHGTVLVGRWPSEEVQSQSSAWKELLPIYLAVSVVVPTLEPRPVLMIVTDSAASVLAINKG